jgi:hypothetical protein
MKESTVEMKKHNWKERNRKTRNENKYIRKDIKGKRKMSKERNVRRNEYRKKASTLSSIVWYGDHILHVCNAVSGDRSL